MNNTINKKNRFILCLLLGYLGIHKFYEKKVLSGILYLFTGGLFCIGWIYDCIKLGIDLYKSKNVVITTCEEKSEATENITLETPISEKNFVTITHPNGKVEQAPDYVILDIDSYVLVCDGGHTYHKCTGCFKKWSSVYQESFKGWNLIPIEEAKEKGLTLCNFCEEALGYNIDDLLELDNQNIYDD